MWLLDANMDVHLLVLLRQFGQKAEATTRRGWAALNNGDLVSIATQKGFTCLLTQDDLFAEAAARALKAHPNFAVVVVHLPQRPWKQYQDVFKAAWLKSPITPILGSPRKEAIDAPSFRNDDRQILGNIGHQDDGSPARDRRG